MLENNYGVVAQGGNADKFAVLYKDHIYAYVITVTETTAEEIKRKLRENFPNYLIPDDIFFLESLPVLPGGKMDKNALISMIDVINFIQILVENYIDKENEEAFVMSLIDNINMISIKDIEKKISEFGTC